MTANRHKINIHGVNIDWYFANSLRSICVKKYFLLSITLRTTQIELKENYNRTIIIF